TIPETATTWRSNTISSARDSLMFGSSMSSYASADARNERRAVAARSFFLGRNLEIFISMRKCLHERAKLIAAIGITLEHIEGRCARRKEDDLSRFGCNMRLLNRVGEGTGHVDPGRAVP